MNLNQLNKKIKKIPPHLAGEVNDFIDFLIDKHLKRKEKKESFSFSWEGSLSEFYSEYSSVELQHKVNMWR